MMLVLLSGTTTGLISDYSRFFDIDASLGDESSGASTSKQDTDKDGKSDDQDTDDDNDGKLDQQDDDDDNDNVPDNSDTDDDNDNVADDSDTDDDNDNLPDDQDTDDDNDGVLIKTRLYRAVQMTNRQSLDAWVPLEDLFQLQ